jgi:hypothetical protein
MYFTTLWNVSDVLTPVLVIVLVSFDLQSFAGNNEEFEWPSILVTVHSVASLLMWTKFLYFLRIFRQTGYLIRMLSTVIYDMRIFLLFLLIVYFGFGEAFLRLS